MTVFLMSCFSNIGGAAINEVALDFWHSGQNREDIGMEDLEHLLRAEAMEAEGTCTAHSQTHHNLHNHFCIFISCWTVYMDKCLWDAEYLNEFPFTAIYMQTYVFSLRFSLNMFSFLFLNYVLPVQVVLHRASWCQAILLTSLYRSCRWSTGMWNYVHVMHMQLVAFSRTRGRWMKWPKPWCMFLRRRNSSLHRAANPFLKGSISFYHNGA